MIKLKYQMIIQRWEEDNCFFSRFSRLSRTKMVFSEATAYSWRNLRRSYYLKVEGNLLKTDSNSEFERIVLNEIYQRGYKLPDAAQVLIPEANCKPDFIYHLAEIAVFCDGSVHDNPEQRKQDTIERDNLKQ